MLCCAVPVVLCCAVLCCAVLCCTMLGCAMLWCAVLHRGVRIVKCMVGSLGEWVHSLFALPCLALLSTFSAFSDPLSNFSCARPHPSPHSSHPAIAKVAFTGSTVTGRRVYAAAAGNLRPATMELGGKSGGLGGKEVFRGGQSSRDLS